MFFATMIHHRTLRWLSFLAIFLAIGAARATNWNYLDGPYGGQPTTLINDAAGNAWAGLNGAGVYYRGANTGIWTYRPDLPTQSNAHFAIDGAGTVYISGSSGLYKYPIGASTWTKISGTAGLPDQAAGGLVTDAAGTVYAAMNTAGVYKLATGSAQWTLTGTGLPADALANDLVIDSAGNLWASVFGTGVFKFPAGGTAWVETDSGLSQPKILALIAIGSDLFGGIQFGGVVKLPNAAGGGSAWIPWFGGIMSAQDAVYAFARGPNDTLYAAGSGVVYGAVSGSNNWSQIGAGVESMGPGNALVYSPTNHVLTIGNSSGIFTLNPGSPTWQPSMTGMTAATIYAQAVASNGDVYAATFGQGVQRQVNGASTWSEVDPANSYPVVGAITIDSHGIVYATPGGVVKKLVGDTWTIAGSAQNSFAFSLAVDGADTLWAGQSGAVRRLPFGTATWATAGTGLPPGNIVNALAIDSAGAAYAAIFGTGIYVLPAGGTTWTLTNLGLVDTNIHALQRDPSGAIYVGNDSGVYRFAGGGWQKYGSGTLQFVNALAFDSSGTAYAGTDNDYAWQLVAGTSAWTQLRSGLGSRSIRALASGGGRIYAGTDGTRGAPSGVYVLAPGDSVVEFYNTILDNFFVTANAAEQAAIAGGSAGPGWIVTGNAFSAGGAGSVCRFYGSLSPGPNSHFYTIDPGECQQLKNIQTTTPPTEKRWNFESNDFASTSPPGGQCPAGTLAVYRAYNNGFARGVDSNHRVTSNVIAYLQQTARGWIGEGVVMCAPR
ncbi:MAG: hypothetical protein ABIS68_00915 [Casimicrobiaceae bacterium]